MSVPKEVILVVRDTAGHWNVVGKERGDSRPGDPQPFRTEGSAQREGSRLLAEAQIDAFKIFRLVSEHH